MQVKLNYPVMVLPRKNDMIYVYFKEKDLKSTSEELFRKLDYADLDLIDTMGCKYKIQKAFKVKYLGLWGFNPLLKGRQILIDFEYDSSVEDLLLEDLKKEIINRVERNNHFWVSAWNIDELINRLQESKTFEAIAKLLS